MLNSPKTAARWAGALYLLIIVLGLWSEVAVRMALLVPGDATATAANIVASEGLFRLSFAADSVMALADVALGVLLLALFFSVSPVLAVMAMAFRLVQAAVIAANLMSQHGALLVVTGEVPLVGFAPDQTAALAMMAAELQGYGYDLGLIFFGVNSLLTGWLVWRSGFLPRVIGLLLGGAGLVYLTGSYLLFLLPAVAPAFAPAYGLPVLAESAFCLWLLTFGIREAGYRAAPAVAFAR